MKDSIAIAILAQLLAVQDAIQRNVVLDFDCYVDTALNRIRQTEQQIEARKTSGFVWECPRCNASNSIDGPEDCWQCGLPKKACKPKPKKRKVKKK